MPQPAVAQPRRIVSLDYCADQFVLALADREQIAALSRGARRDDSYFRARAAGIRQTRGALEEVLALDPQGVVLSNGPGDPEPLVFAAETARALAHAVPVFGICLGHQLLGLAFGGSTTKLRFGHRGINHPVIDRRLGAIEITSQNHGFTVDPASLPDEIERTHFSCNDGTLEGFRHRSLPVLSCQYHPEASAGPHDARPWFGTFAALVAKHALRTPVAPTLVGALH